MLSAEDVAWPRWPAGRHAVLLLFQRHAGAALPGLRRRRAEGLADRLFGQGQWQSGGAEDAGAAGRRRRCGVGRRTEEGAGAAGIPADRIVFSGVGKTRAEMQLALEAGIYQFNVESEPELEALERGGAASWTCARPSPCASIPMSMPRPTPRSPPARRKPNSAFPGAMRATPMRWPRG